ncbi:MAG: autotransporter domain-containing protein [Rhizobiales bacterium]|nr:autotransporter domain-containing protein [Hyphomicrobiales bacterium]
MRHHISGTGRALHHSLVFTTAILMASVSVQAVLAADIAATTNGAAVPGDGDTIQSGVTVSNETNTGAETITITGGNNFTNNGTVTSVAGSTENAIGASSADGIVLTNNASGLIEALGGGNAIRLDNDITLINAGTIFSSGDETVRLDDDADVTNTGTIQNDLSPASGDNAISLRVGTGVVNNGTALDYENAKIISNGNATNLSGQDQDSNVYALRAGDRGTITVNNYGLIQANGDAASVEEGANEGEVGAVRLEGDDSILNNYGTIETTGAIVVGADTNADASDDGYEIGDMYGVRVDGLNATVHNYAGGTITGGKHGITIDDATSGVTVINDLGATITGLNGSGVGSDTDGSVTNYGTIIGTFNDAYDFGDGDGVDIDLVGSVYNYGTIAGQGSKGTKPGELNPSNSEGIAFGGGTIVNGDLSHLTASITGADNGILIDDSNGGDALGSTDITNFGSIEGTDGFGVRMINTAGTYNLTFDNYGSITGGNGYAVQMGGGDDAFTQYFGTITGIVDGEAGSDALNFDTASTVTYDSDNFVNFEVTSVLSGFLTLTNDFSSTTSFDVASGASFASSGTITTAAFTNAGDLFPGGDGTVGTLTIDGDFANAATGSLNIEMGEEGVDQLAVTGAATLDGASTLNLYKLSTFRTDLSYELITSTSLTGTFGTVNDYLDLVYVTPDFDYQSDNLTLSFTRTGVDYADNANAFGAPLATALDNLIASGTPSSDVAALIGQIDSLSASESAALFDALMPDTTGAQTGITTDMLGLFFSGVQGRLGALNTAERAGGSIQLAANGAAGDLTASLYGPAFYGSGADYGFWMRAFGQAGKTDARSGLNDGYDYQGGGLQAGYDFRLDESTILGLSAGYAHADINPDRVTTDGNVDSYLVGLYAGKTFGAFDLSGQLGAAFNRHETSRYVNLFGTVYEAQGDYDGLTLSGSAELGYTIAAGSWTLRPVAGLDLFHIHTEGYTETGAPGANLTQSSYDDVVLRSSLGLGLATQFDAGFLGQVIPSADIRWGHDIDQADDTATWSFAGSPGSAFQVASNQQDRDALLLGLGLQAFATDDLSLGLTASGDFRENATSGGLSLNLRYSW